MRFTNAYNVPLSVAVWLVTDDYDHDPFPGQKHISATSLLKPIRMLLLEDRAKATKEVETIIDIHDLLASRRGTAIHKSIEDSWKLNHRTALKLLGHPQELIDRVVVNPTPEELKKTPKAIPVYLEVRNHKKLDDYVVSGQLDFVLGGRLEDFKNMKVYSYMYGSADEEHMLQGSINRWLNPQMITQDTMRIQFLFVDWNANSVKSMAAKGYPEAAIVTREHQLLSLADTEEFVKNKLAELKEFAEVPEKELPECSATDLWQSPTVYKYFSKPTNKRCQVSSENYAEVHAKMLAKGTGIIKEYPGEVRRCKYCSARTLCTQKDQFIAMGLLTLND